MAPPPRWIHTIDVLSRTSKWRIALSSQPLATLARGPVTSCVHRGTAAQDAADATTAARVPLEMMCTAFQASLSVATWGVHSMPAMQPLAPLSSVAAAAYIPQSVKKGTCKLTTSAWLVQESCGRIHGTRAVLLLALHHAKHIQHQ